MIMGSNKSSPLDTKAIFFDLVINPEVFPDRIYLLLGSSCSDVGVYVTELRRRLLEGKQN